MIHFKTPSPEQPALSRRAGQSARPEGPTDPQTIATRALRRRVEKDERAEAKERAEDDKRMREDGVDRDASTPADAYLDSGLGAPMLASAAPSTAGVAITQADAQATSAAAASPGTSAAPLASADGAAGMATAQAQASQAMALILAAGFVLWQATRERAPTVTITIDDPLLALGEQGTLRFEFDRAVQGFDVNDIEIDGGSVSNLRATADPRVFLATLTPDPGMQARADGGTEIRVSVKGSSYLNTQGKPGRGASLALDADTVAPRVALFSTEQAVTAGSRTPIDLVFSDPIQGLGIEDLIVTEGRIEDLVVSAANARGEPFAFRAVFIADSTDFDPAAARLEIRSGSYTDLAGNPGAGGSTVIDIRVPQLLSITSNDTANTITLRYDLGLRSGQGAPTLDRFEVIQGGGVLSVSSVTVQGDTVTLSVPDLGSGAFTLRYDDTGPSDGEAVIQSASGIDAGSFMRGLVADGYIAGARIYLDDGDGVLEPGVDLDTGVITATDGSFVLGSAALAALAGGRTLIAVGGINTDTLVPNTLTLAAPAGATVINPLTTIAQAMVASQAAASFEAAETLIAQAFGLNLPQAGLARFDPIAGTRPDMGPAGGDAAALAAQKVAAKLATLLMYARTQQGATGAAEAAERSLIEAMVSVIVEHAAETASAGGAGAPTPLDLSDAATLTALAGQAAFIAAGRSDLADISIAWSAQALENLEDIRVAPDLESVSLAQQTLLDNTAPAAPVLKTLIPSMNGVPDRFLVELPRARLTAGDLQAGDRIEIRDAAGAVIASHLLSTGDLSTQLARVYLEGPAPEISTLSLHVIDRAGNSTAAGGAAVTSLPSAPRDSDTFDLGAMLLPFIQAQLQGVANFEIPLVGRIGDLLDTKGLSLWLDGAFARLPAVKLFATQDGPVLKSADSSGFYFGFDDTSGSGGSDNAGGSTGGGGSTESGWSTDGGSSSDSGFIGLEPGGEDPTNNGAVDWDPAEGAEPSAYRFTGPQTHLPEKIERAHIDAVTGDFELVLVYPEEWFNEGFGGMVTGSAGMAFIDANLAGHGVFEFRLAGNFKPTGDAYNFLTLDPAKSGLKLHADLGVAPGSTVGGTLGPLWIEGQDQLSKYASTTAQRKNTGIEGGITIGFKDFDGTADKKLSVLKGAETLLSGDSGKSLGDVLSFASFVEGRLSAKTGLGLNLGNVIPNDSWAALADLLSLRLDSDITASFKHVYDSKDATKSDGNHAVVHFDDVAISLAPLIGRASGGVVSVVDTVMTPLYTVENFFSTEIPIPAGLSASSPSLELPSWLPDFAKHFVNDIVGAPLAAVDGLLSGFVSAMDVDGNGQVTIIELIEQTARYYASFVNFIEELWTPMVAMTPGLVDALKATPYGSTVVAVLNSFQAQKEFFEFFFEYFDYFKQALYTINQIEQLSGLYQSALAEIEGLTASQLNVFTLPLGSFKWDIANETFAAMGGNTYSLIERALPPRSDPEPGLTTADALKRLDAAVINHIFTPSIVSPTVGNIHEYVFKQAGITGVTQDNVETIHALMTDGNLRSILVSNPGSIFYDNDKILVSLTQKRVDAYNLIQRVAGGRNTPEDIPKIVESLGEVLQRSFDLKFKNDKANSLLLKMIQAIGPAELDSKAEIAELVTNAEAWLALNGHRGDPTVKNPVPGSTLLTAAQFKALGLELLSESAITTINDTIKSYNGDFNQFYGTVRTQVSTLNKAWIDAQEKAAADGGGDDAAIGLALAAAVNKIRDAAEDNTASTLTLADFSRAGLTGLSAKNLAGFASFMDSSVLGKAQFGSISAAQKAIDAYKLLLDTAGAPVDTKNAKAFYDAIDLLLQGTRAAEMEHIPHANYTSKRPDSRTPTLPLLQQIIANRSDEQIDTYAELDALFTATREVLMASMANPKLWEKGGLEKHAPWKSDATALNAAITKHKDYKTTLTVDQLKLIGFSNATDETLTAIKTELTNAPAGRYEAAEYFYWETFENRETGQYLKPAAPKTALKLADLGTVDAVDATGPDRIADLLKDLPAVKAFWLAAKDLGLEFPILNDLGKDLIMKFVDNELIDLIRFTPKLPTIENLSLPLSYNLAELLPFYDTIDAVVPFEVPVTAEAIISIIPRLSIGADTWALQSIRNQEGRSPLELFANSIYLLDEYEVDGAIYDLPELEIDVSLIASLGAMLGKSNGLANLYAKIFGGLDLKLEVDIIGDDSGKLRIGDMLGTIADVSLDSSLLQQLADNLFDVIQFSGGLDLTLGAKLGVNVDLTPEDRSNLGAITTLLLDAYNALPDWLQFADDEFNWEIGPEFTHPIVQFDSAQNQWFLNV